MKYMDSIPQWLKKRITVNEEFFRTKQVLSDLSINTVCESSRCPNLNECFSKGFATFMILGTTCTRACAFCFVKKRGAEQGRRPRRGIDPEEPGRIADCVKRLGLKYVVLTSVARDDLDDGGAGQFVKVIKAVRDARPDSVIELLVPDFSANAAAVKAVSLSGADIIGHNIETIPRLYPVVRKGADYSRSLNILKFIKEICPKTLTKSAILAGLGETEEEIVRVMEDLSGINCDILMIGQYLRPSKENHPIARFVTPEEFERLRRYGMELGFKYVSASPFVRSSYMAEENFKSVSGNSEICSVKFLNGHP